MTEAASTELSSILMAMRLQEPSYRSGDYLYTSASSGGANNESTWGHAGVSAPMMVQPGAVENARNKSYHHQQAQQPQHHRRATNMNETWRRKICEWKYQIVDYYNIDREVVSVSMTYLDRYLALSENHSPPELSDDNVPSSTTIDKKQFQLAAMTSLYIAIKLYENNFDAVGDKLVRKSNKLRISTLVELSRGYFERHHFIEMEQVILFRLGWKMHPPTSVQFITYLLDLLPINNESNKHVLYELARYLAELAVCVYNLSALHAPSTVAYAAILNAMTALRCTNSPASNCLTSEVYHQFINNVSNVARIRMDCHEVKTVREALELLCPQAPRGAAQGSDCFGDDPALHDSNVRDQNMVSSSSDDDTDVLMDQNSPVCVSKGPNANNNGSSNDAVTAAMSTTASTASMRSEVTMIQDHAVAAAGSAHCYNAQHDNYAAPQRQVDVVSPPKCKRLHQSQSDECPWENLVPGGNNAVSSSSVSAAASSQHQQAQAHRRMQTASPVDSECSKRSSSSSSGSSSRASSALNFFSSSRQRVHPSAATSDSNNAHGPHEC